jgi:hypothetical protein
MGNAAWLLRCPHCDERFGHAPANLRSPQNIVNCPVCHHDFAVKVNVNIETNKLGIVVR